MNLLSIVIPARDEEGCIASTVEHLHLELQLRGVPHEIIVVDDGSSDRTWEILQAEATRLNATPNTPKDGATASSIQNPSAADSAQRKRPGFSSKIQNSKFLPLRLNCW